MKALLAIAALSISLSAQAETKPAASTTTAPAAAVTSQKPDTKPSARDVCLRENARLAGAELDACVKAKEKATK